MFAQKKQNLAKNIFETMAGSSVTVVELSGEDRIKSREIQILFARRVEIASSLSRHVVGARSVVTTAA